MKKQFQLVSTLFVLMVTIVGFQNCGSNVKFSQIPTEESASSAPITTDAVCSDAAGASHDSGSTWNTTTSTTQSVPCLDAGDSNQGYQTQDTYLCTNGVVTQTASVTTQVSPTAACPSPVLSASLSNAAPQSGGSTNLLVSANTVDSVSYTCSSVATGKSFSSGALTVGDSTTAVTNVIEDLSCVVSATYGTQTLTKTLGVSVNCDSSGKLKDPTTHQCVEFACKTYVSLGANADGSYTVPARTTDGICYSIQLMSAIPAGPSSLTTTIDDEVISRNHDLAHYTYLNTHHPYSMSKTLTQFTMTAGGGAREIKLAGSNTTAASITVDNFVLVGLATKAATLGNVSNYHAYGSQDSTVDAANSYVLMNNQEVPFSSFGAGGITTVSALDITTEVSVSVPYLLDVRALDCGGSRELSNIYLIFQ